MAERLDEIMTVMVRRKKLIDTESFNVLIGTIFLVSATMFGIWYFVGDW